LKRQKYILPILLPLIAAVCVWIWASGGIPATQAESDNGTWDLRGADFSSGSMNLHGSVEYIPGALLAPGEFEEQRDAAALGDPQAAAPFSTSRIRILVTAGTYGLMGYSSEFASRVYINGMLTESIGMPGSSPAVSDPGIKLLFYTAEAPDGVIEIVQQASNYVYRMDDSSHANIIIGEPDAVREIYTKQIAFAAIVLGCFFALALAHLVLYCLHRSYKANLWFMLFCVTWFFRTGLTGPKLLPMLLPLDWYAAFRLEYLTVPAGTLLVCMTLHALFPGTLQKWFLRTIAVICGVWFCVCLFANTVFMSEMMPTFYIVIFLAAAYIITRLCMKLRKPDLEQTTVLIGMGAFLYCALHDILYFSGINILPFVERTIAEVALLVFVFFQMAAMFYGTMREVAASKEREESLLVQNAAIENANRLKATAMAYVAHETRTPIAVISSYTELIAMELRAQGVSEQHAKDLDTISDEIQHIGLLIEEAQNLSRLKSENTGKSRVSLNELINQTARLYVHVLERRRTKLTVELQESLPPVFVNPGEVTQVLLNLLKNAGNHTKNGAVTINAQFTMHNAQFVEVAVRDNGTGISPELLPRVFEHGVSGDENGTGIGLAVCREILRAHDGEIWIESEPGAGTTVRFTLPIHNAQ